MNDEEFRLLAEIEEHHWWFVGKRELLRALLESVPRGEHLLDLGCGTGGMLRELAGTGWSVGRSVRVRPPSLCEERATSAGPRRSGPASLSGGSFRYHSLARRPRAPGRRRRVLARSPRRVQAGGADRHIRPGIPVPLEPARRDVRAPAPVFGETARGRRSRGEAPSGTHQLHERPDLSADHRLAVPLLPPGRGRLATKHDFWPVPKWLNRLLALAYRVEARWLRRFDAPIGLSIVCIRPGSSRLSDRRRQGAVRRLWGSARDTAYGRAGGRSSSRCSSWQARPCRATSARSSELPSVIRARAREVAERFVNGATTIQRTS